jgi:6-phosphogluconolactonase/glucosamine-6-phosphate isomerase/deaminase
MQPISGIFSILNSSKHYDLIIKASVENIAKAALDFIHKDNKVAISGGTTYLDIFPFWIQALKGQNVEFFPVDERVVPFDNPDSNWGMACRHLFDRLEDTVSKKNFAVSVKQYENLLFTKFNGKLPVFDLKARSRQQIV